MRTGRICLAQRLQGDQGAAIPGVILSFGARQMVDYGFIIDITGHIDRPSGRMDVTAVTLDPTKPNDPNIAALRYDVICETNSVF